MGWTDRLALLDFGKDFLALLGAPLHVVYADPVLFCAASLEVAE